MTDLKKAAQQALEALKCLVETYEMGNTIRADIMDAEEAITAIKSALEQPEPPPEAQTEAEKIAYCAGWWAAMEQKREQPEQEQNAEVEYLFTLEGVNALLAAEREACARVCYELPWKDMDCIPSNLAFAAAIRERKS